MDTSFNKTFLLSGILMLASICPPAWPDNVKEVVENPSGTYASSPHQKTDLKDASSRDGKPDKGQSDDDC